ncbi:hypothetical protein ACIPJG_25330 [Streptomyces halstedii]
MTGPERHREAEALLTWASGNFLHGEDTARETAQADDRYWDARYDQDEE